MSCVMVPKEESMEDLRNKNTVRLIGAQSRGGGCGQPGAQRGRRETQAGEGDGGALLAGRRPGHAWRVRSDRQLTAEWWGDGRRGGDRVTAVASQGDIKVA